jgi:hypothetical protein
MQITAARFFDSGGFSVLAELLAPEARVNTSRYQTTLNLIERNAMNRKVRTIGAAAVIQPPSPAYHWVGTGQEYQFLIDYSHLSAAPTGNPAAGFVYAPGGPVAIWQ